MTTPVTNCFSLVRGRALRVTKLDTCGVPLPGPRNQVVTKGVISVGFTAATDEGTTIQVTNANGDTCIRDVPAPKFLNYALQIDLCGVDPDLMSLLTGNEVVLDANGNRVGFTMGTDVDLDDVRFALELWSVVPGEECTGAARTFGYMLIPFIQGGQVGDFTWQNDAINFSVAGAQTKDGNGWGVGPYDVVLDDADAPAPLANAISPSKHLQVMATQVAPPTTGTCGAQPVGTEATGATAGQPGTYTPANTYGADDIAGMADITASPATAWTTGQFVYLSDGETKVHWNGTAWAAGAA